MKKIKVIVVDDSAFMRKVISDILNAEDDIEVITTARNGEDLFLKMRTYQPDVITLDIEMPKMNGLATLQEMKIRNCNIPVIMLSSVSKEGTTNTMECLENGAFDFIAKPSGAISLDIDRIGDDLKNKIRLAYGKNIRAENKNLDSKNMNLEKNFVSKSNIENKNNKNKKIDIVVIGASTGGPKALYNVITKLPPDLGVPVLVVQHMPEGFTRAFAERLNTFSKIKVKEATNEELIEKNTVYIAKGGFHMEVEENKRIILTKEPPIWGVRPAVDKLFISVSRVYGSNVLSVVLTGMGKDGAQGTVAVKDRGGITISEDSSTCAIYGMPKAAFDTGKVDEVLPIYEIAEAIVKNVTGLRR